VAVFVLDKNKKPLMPCSEKRARLLLERKRAVIHLMEPFTIRLKDRKLKDSKLQEQRLKLDPGSKTTGFAVTREESDTVLLGDLEHKKGIKGALDSRRSLRRGRRNRNTRYRKPRFDNRKNSIGKCKHCGNNTPKKETKGKTKGRKSLCTPCAKKGLSSKKTIKLTRETKLSPSLAARADQTFNLAKKLQKITPIDAISMELVKFDLQKMEKPEIQGVARRTARLRSPRVSS